MACCLFPMINPTFLVLFLIFQIVFPAPPFSPSFSDDNDNSIFGSSESVDQKPLSLSLSNNDRSLLPGVQVFSPGSPFLPFQQQMPFGANGLVSQRSLDRFGGSMDLETWTKNQAMRTNQENAVVSQLAQMAPHRRNQLVRDAANGNASATNELVTRLLRDLASSQHGQIVFPDLPQAIIQQQQHQAFLLANGRGGGGLPFSRLNGGPTSTNSLMSLQQNGASGLPIPLPLQMQLLAAQQQQLNGPVGGNRFFLSGLTPQNPSQMLLNRDEQLLRQQLLGPSQSSSSPFSPFMANEFTDLSRPNPSSSAFFNSPSSTQISPFSQSSQQAMLRTRGSSQNGQNPSEFSKTLSGASSSQSSSPFGGGFSLFRGGMMDNPQRAAGEMDNIGRSGFMASADGFDPDDTMLFGRRTATAAGVGTMLGEGKRNGNDGQKWMRTNDRWGRRKIE